MEMNENNFNNMNHHESQATAFEKLNFGSDMWHDDDLHTPLMKPVDQYNDMIASNMLNVTPVDQTINPLEPHSSWYEPLESIISSTNTSVDQSPQYTTSMDKIPKTGIFQNNLIRQMDSNGVEVSLEENIHGANMNSQPISFKAVEIKKENPGADVLDTNQSPTETISSTTKSSSASNKKAKSGTSPTTKKQRKKLTNDQKLAHNKIEKRYRININTKIAKLQQIIPWVASNDTAFEVSKHLSDSRSNSLTGEGAGGKVNKSKILDKAVDYIEYLQNNEQMYRTEINKLKEQNQKLMNALTVRPDANNANYSV